MKYIKLEDIKIDENQPRTTFNENELNNLAISIKEIGILQPILITSDNTIIDGERRYRASKIANLENIPCYTIQSLPNNQIELAQIIANTNRSDLTGLEIAKAVKKILETGLDKKDVAKLLNKQPSYISRLVAMLDDKWLPLVEKNLIASPNALEALKALPEKEQQVLIEQAKQNNKPITRKEINNTKKDNGNNSLDNDNLIDYINKKFRKIKLNKNQLKDVIDFINENEQIEIILNNKLADDIENLIN